MANWQSGLEGAGGGALAGASVAGPWGAVIGGGIGLLSGLFGNEDQDKQRQMIEDYYNQVKNRQTPQAGPASQASYSDFRGNQKSLVNRLEAMANGQGPSLAAQQFQQATDRNVASQQAVANSGRGGALAQVTAANNIAGLGAQQAQGSAIARTGEELGAIGQLGGVINQGRTADENLGMFNAGQRNSMAQANLEAQLKAMGYNDQAIAQIIAAQGGMQGQKTTGDAILAGGAGMYGASAAQAAQLAIAKAKAAQASNGNGTPQDGGVTSPDGR